MSYLPDTIAPVKALLTRMEAILREGIAGLHDPLPPAWAGDDPCPAGHYCIPEGMRLYRYDRRPVSGQTATPALALSADGNMVTRHLDDSRYWNVPLRIWVIQDADTTDTTAALMRDLSQLFFDDVQTTAGAVDTVWKAEARLSSADVNVFDVYGKDEIPDALFEGHPSHVLTFTAFAGGIAPA